MRITLLFFIIPFIFSCSKDENIEPGPLMLEEALASQFISFEVELIYPLKETKEPRKVIINELKEDRSPSWPPLSNSFDLFNSIPVTRRVSVIIPKEEVKGHFEEFEIEFNSIFGKKEVDETSKKVLSDQNFTTNFLSVGRQNLSNFSFTQNYIHGEGLKGNSALVVTSIQKIRDQAGSILVAGKFSGNIGWRDEIVRFTITNGKFKVLLQN